VNWEEAIIHARKDPEFKNLIALSYLESDLKLNAERFMASEEFHETLKIMKQYAENAKLLADIGAGNGISSIAFALAGFKVEAVEPDPSVTVGRGAINFLKDIYKINTLNIHAAFGEQLPFEDNSLDVVYLRQAMHHAQNLEKFAREAGRVLKRGGLMLSVRDHVIYDQRDKQWFLNTHPLQKYYHGENAYTEKEYSNAITHAGLEIKKMFRHYENPINYYPVSREEIKSRPESYSLTLKNNMHKRLGILSGFKPFALLYATLAELKNGKIFDERKVAGRMYSFIAIKK